MSDQDLRRRIDLLEDEVRYLRRRLDDAIARPTAPVFVPLPSYPLSPSPSVPEWPLVVPWCTGTVAAQTGAVQ